MHTTNYVNTLIAVSDDCPTKKGEVPPPKSEPTVASLQYEMVSKHPYTYTSDDIIFHCFAVKQGLKKTELKKAREQFFSKGQACMRSSPLVKRYGWGVHSNAAGKIALYSVHSPEYKKFLKDTTVTIKKGMKSKK